MTETALEQKAFLGSFGILVDGTSFQVSQAQLTASALVRMAGKDPATHFLVVINPGFENSIVEEDEAIDLQQSEKTQFLVVAKLDRYSNSLGMPARTGASPEARRILGLFSSPEDAALMDDVLELVQKDREKQNSEPPRA